MSEPLDLRTLSPASLSRRLEAADKPEGGCFSCVHLVKETESWEMPHVAWFECTAMPHVSNLRGWPWRSTKCSKRRSPGGLIPASTLARGKAQRDRG